MPLPHFHSCRLCDPGDFQPDSFRTVTRSHNGKEYSVIMGKLKDKDSMTEQSYRYKKDIWSESEAKDHCKEHGGNFEPAKEDINKSMAVIDRLIKHADYLIGKHVLMPMVFNHNSELDPNEPDWGSVDKAKLPREAFADMGEPNKKSTWRYPHHHVKGGKILDENGCWKDGILYLNKGGLHAAWAAANGARSGQEASPSVKAHLNNHRKAIGQE